MSTLQGLLDSLPAHGPTLPLFLRDDDAGWCDARLLQLLDTTAEAGAPIDLAVIPGALTPGLAATLRRRHDAAPGLLGLHQHGCRHDNHEAEGRRCEFGMARDAAQQRDDLVLGRDLLQQQFGDRLDGLFTPPWNRCAPHTPNVLAMLGYAGLSRDRSAPAQNALPELPVDVDWTRHHRSGGAAAVEDALAAALRARLGDGQPMGLMLHHAVMDNDEFALLAHLLRRLAAHPRLQWQPMRGLLPQAVAAQD